MPDKETVTFMADGADEAIARYRRWSGANDTDDLGVSDGWHRYRVDAGLWSAYVREKTGR